MGVLAGVAREGVVTGDMCFFAQDRGFPTHKRNPRRGRANAARRGGEREEERREETRQAREKEKREREKSEEKTWEDGRGKR